MAGVAFAATLLGIAAYLFFLGFCIVSLRRRVTGRALLLAASANLVWLACLLLARPLAQVLEPIAVLTWIFLLSRAVGAGTLKDTALRPVQYAIISASILSVVAAGVVVMRPTGTLIIWNLALVVINIIGMVLLEQLTRNAVSDYRWRVRYLIIGLSLVFAFGLIHHATTILFSQSIPVLLALHPAVLAVVVPFIIVASLRNRSNQLRFNISRNFVFQTGVLVAAGAFLLALGVFGYLAQLFGGDLGLALAVFAGVLGIGLFFILVGSSEVRTRLRIAIQSTFFEFKYDYRDEWIKLSNLLTEPSPDFNLSQQTQRALLSLLHARHSALWINSAAGQLVPQSHIESPDWLIAPDPALSRAINQFYTERDWVIDTSHAPDEANEIVLAMAAQFGTESPRYLIPLLLDSGLVGVVVVGAPEVAHQLSWEDYDILKLVSRQCAGFIALERLNNDLRDQQQLNTMNQVSAFLVHDLKTIAAQLSLMLDNAPQHKANPAFIDDMLATTGNSVRRLEHIIGELRQTDGGGKVESNKATVFDAVQLIAELQSTLVDPNDLVEPIQDSEPIFVIADRARVNTALIHLLKNAMEAVGASGKVNIKAGQANGWASIEITDNGTGMSQEFIANELFAPFKTSKGISGMGVGAYQAREHIRNCGGDLHVDSNLGLGTTFTVKLPLSSENDPNGEFELDSATQLQSM